MSIQSYSALRKARMERLEDAWESLAERQVILAMKSIDALNVQWDERISTACVGFGKNATKPCFKFNPTFFDSLNEDQILFVIAHETSHMVMKHVHNLVETDEYKDNFKAFNIAADCIINDWLHKCGYPSGPWFYGKKFFCEHCGGQGCSEDINNCSGTDCSDKTLSDVFKMVMNKMEQEGEGEGQPGEGEGEGEGEGYGGQGGEMVDDHDEWQNADSEKLGDWIKENITGSPGEQEQQNQNNQSQQSQKSETEPGEGSGEGGGQGENPVAGIDVDNSDEIRTSDTDGWEDNQYGKIGENKSSNPSFTSTPGNIVGSGAMFNLDELRKVRANWRAILTEGTGMKEKSRLSWRRNPTVLMGNSNGYRLPYEQDEPVMRILVALDVSGSVSEQDKRLFLDCWRGIPRNAFDVRSVVFANRCAEIKPSKKSKKEFKHDYVGGGTEFSAITDWIKTNNYEPDKIVVITDGGSYWRYTVKNPEKYNFVIRCRYYENSDGTVDAQKLIGSWTGYYDDDKTNWKQAKFYGFEKFAKVLGGAYN